MGYFDSERPVTLSFLESYYKKLKEQNYIKDYKINNCHIGAFGKLVYVPSVDVELYPALDNVVVDINLKKIK